MPLIPSRPTFGITLMKVGRFNQPTLAPTRLDGNSYVYMLSFPHALKTVVAYILFGSASDSSLIYFFSKFSSFVLKLLGSSTGHSVCHIQSYYPRLTFSPYPSLIYVSNYALSISSSVQRATMMLVNQGTKTK